MPLTKEAQQAKNKAYYAANKEKERARCKAYHETNNATRLAVKKIWREANAEINSQKRIHKYHADIDLSRRNAALNNAKQKDYRDKWREKNKDRLVIKAAEYVRNNRPHFAAKTARRRAMKLQATPKWADVGLIKDVYKQADEASTNGVKYEVDHFYPLQGRTVCGLHVHSNLRVVTRTQNRKKRNFLPEAYL